MRVFVVSCSTLVMRAFSSYANAMAYIEQHAKLWGNKRSEYALTELEIDE
jgi:hypothetical protein